MGAGPDLQSYSIRPVTANLDVSDAQRLAADADQDNWLLYGRTYDNQRFSPLTQITQDNVKKLRPVAIIQTGITKSFENTPIVVDGVMYLETGDNHVQAWDAVTGQQLWSYNPPTGYNNLCCGEQSRGVAVAYGKVYAAQLSGHVVALDARTGQAALDHRQQRGAARAGDLLHLHPGAADL